MNDPVTVACLAGDGVGPELMASATRALGHVAHLHALELDEVYLPYAGEAVTRSGHPLPAATRERYRNVDAILVSSSDEPAFDGVKADLELSWRIARVHLGERKDVVVVAPLGPWADATAIEHAFTCASSRRARVAAVGTSEDWYALVERGRAGHPGLQVERVGLGEAVIRLKERPEEVDVVVTEAHLLDALVEAASHFAGSKASVAHGWMPESGPGVFAPGESESDHLGGFDAADPTGMLLTVSLLLAEGLKRRAASRTLERAVGAVAGRSGSAPRETRGFTDAVIELLPQTRTDVEHFDEVWR
ncbi:MAG TPA: isocitrate/isopropylmalate family dehydrogenase [Gaiellaceae bacterium]